MPGGANGSGGLWLGGPEVGLAGCGVRREEVGLPRSVEQETLRTVRTQKLFVRTHNRRQTERIMIVAVGETVLLLPCMYISLHPY